MPPPGDAEDRAAILRRRAAFVASALSGLAPSVAQAQDAPPPLSPAAPEAAPAAPGAPAQVADACPPQEPGAEERERAKALVARALELEVAGDDEGAAAELAAAGALVTSDALAAQRMQLAVRLGRPYEAVDVALAHVACGGGGIEALRPMMAEIERESGRLTVTLAGAVSPDVGLLLDGRGIDLARAARGLAVTPGRHRLDLVSGGGAGTTRTVEVAVGQAVAVSLEAPPEVPPMPCLNYIDPRITADRVRLEAGVLPPVPFVAFGEPAKALVSVGGRLALQIALPDKLWLETDLFSTFLGDEHARAVQVGASLEARMPVSGPYAVGGGFGAGYLFDLGDAQDDSALTSSLFCGPVLLPLHVRYEELEIEVRVPLWIARTTVQGIESFRPALFGPVISIGFAGAVTRSDDG